MNKAVKPPVAAAIIAVTVVVLGYFIYAKAVVHNKTTKVSQAISMPGFKEAMQKKWQQEKGTQPTP